MYITPKFLEKHTRMKIAKLYRLTRSNNGGGFPNWIRVPGGGASSTVTVFLWCFVIIFPESSAENIHISIPRYKSRNDALKAVIHKMYERLTFEKKFNYEIVSFIIIIIIIMIIIYHSPRNTAVGSPGPIDLEKTNKSQKTPPYDRKRTEFRSCFLCLPGCCDIKVRFSRRWITISSLVDEQLPSTTEKRWGRW